MSEAQFPIFFAYILPQKDEIDPSRTNWKDTSSVSFYSVVNLEGIESETPEVCTFYIEEMWK